MQSLTSQQLKNLWYQTALNFDHNIAAELARDYLVKQTWSDSIFKNLIKGIEQLRTLEPEFFRQYDYDWIFEPESYDFYAEPLYQLNVICTLIGNLDHINNINQLGLNVCARVTNNWGLSDSIPKAIPPIQRTKFVVIPHGWEDISWFIFDGFFTYIDRRNAQDISALLSINNCTRTLNDMNYCSIAAKNIVGRLAPPDIQGAEFNQALISTIKQLQSAKLHMDEQTEMTTLIGCCQLASSFAVAHEVGHHLDDQWTQPQDELCELRMDAIAMRGLWNCDFVIRINLMLHPSLAVLWAIGGLFFLISVGIFSEIENQNKTQGLPHTRQWWKRIDHWQRCVHDLAQSEPMLQNEIAQLNQLSEYSRRFIIDLSTAVNQLTNTVLPSAKAILKEIKNPKASIPKYLNANLAQEIKAQKQKNN